MRKRLVPLILALVLIIFLPLQSFAADYTSDGSADNVEYQAALNTLPASGGKISFTAGTYTFASTPARAIDNVIVEGASSNTTIINGTLTAGSQSHWVFRHLKATALNVSAASSWIFDDVYIGSTYYDYLSSNSFTATSETAYTISPTGSNDHTVINNAFNTHKNLLLAAGTWEISGNIYPPANSKLLGVGNTTILHFSGSAYFSTSNVSNVEIGKFKMTGSSTSDANFFISTSNTNVSAFYIHDVTDEASGCSHFTLYSNASGSAGRSISNVEFVRCTSTASDGFGFLVNGEGTEPTFNNINYYRCSATDTGVAETRINAYVTCYDFIEPADGILTNQTAMDCTGVGSTESVFHYEVAPTKTNCKLIQCTGSYGGKENPSSVYGYGFLIGDGVICITCTASNNVAGFYTSSGGTLTNCAAVSNTSGNFNGTIFAYTIATTYVATTTPPPTTTTPPPTTTTPPPSGTSTSTPSTTPSGVLASYTGFTDFLKMIPLLTGLGMMLLGGILFNNGRRSRDFGACLKSILFVLIGLILLGILMPTINNMLGT